jgi:hypothetical protein
MEVEPHRPKLIYNGKILKGEDTMESAGIVNDTLLFLMMGKK